MPPLFPADTETTRPAYTRFASTSLMTASGPEVGHVGPEPSELLRNVTSGSQILRLLMKAP